MIPFLMEGQPTLNLFLLQMTHLSLKNTITSYHHSQSLPADDPDLVVSEEKVVAIIHSLPLKKAPGPDHVTNEHLKFGGSVFLTALFNAVFLSGHIPAPFRHSLIFPIPKGHNKDLSKLTNYRGITLLSVFGKNLKRCFNTVLQICSLN